jgi:hypothetical protein
VAVNQLELINTWTRGNVNLESSDTAMTSRFYDDMIYLLTAAVLSPGGSTHIHTNNTENNTNNNRTTQITTNVDECGPCPVFASFTPAFVLQLRTEHGKPCQGKKNLSRVKKNFSQSM